MRFSREPAPARPERRSCTYKLFRNKPRPELLCAVPEDRSGPSFLASQEWEFERHLRPWHNQPGFRDRAAHAGVQLNGFYLFQATAKPADDGQKTAEGGNVHRHVQKVLLCLVEYQNILRHAAAGGPNQGADRRPLASLKWMEPQYAGILEALPLAIYTTDAAGWIMFYNEAAAALWGRRPVLGQDRWCGSWRIYLHDGTRLPHDCCPMAVALRENREVRGLTAVAERPDGTRVPFMPFPTPLHDANHNLIGAFNVLIAIKAA
jgi:PAS domain-containing protein